MTPAVQFFLSRYKGTDIMATQEAEGRSAKDGSRGICGHCEGDCGSADSR